VVVFPDPREIRIEKDRWLVVADVRSLVVPVAHGVRANAGMCLTEWFGGPRGASPDTPDRRLGRRHQHTDQDGETKQGGQTSLHVTLPIVERI
jgi:hypothetical protein